MEKLTPLLYVPRAPQDQFLFLEYTVVFIKQILRLKLRCFALETCILLR